MPKMKSRSAVKKRFKVTKTGKVIAKHPGRGHLHASYGGKTSRRLRSPLVLNQTWGKLIKAML